MEDSNVNTVDPGMSPTIRPGWSVHSTSTAWEEMPVSDSHSLPTENTVITDGETSQYTEYLSDLSTQSTSDTNTDSDLSTQSTGDTSTNSDLTTQSTGETSTYSDLSTQSTGDTRTDSDLTTQSIWDTRTDSDLTTQNTRDTKTDSDLTTQNTRDTNTDSDLTTTRNTSITTSTTEAVMKTFLTKMNAQQIAKSRVRLSISSAASSFTFEKLKYLTTNLETTAQRGYEYQASTNTIYQYYETMCTIPTFGKYSGLFTCIPGDSTRKPNDCVACSQQCHTRPKVKCRAMTIAMTMTMAMTIFYLYKFIQQIYNSL